MRTLFSKDSIYRKLAGTFLLTILPLILAGIALLHWTKEEVRKEVEHGAYANVSYLIQTLEEQLFAVSSTMWSLPYQTQVQRLVNRHQSLEAHEYYMLLQNIQDHIGMICLNNVYIDDITLYLPQIGHSLSKFAGYREINQRDFEELLSKEETALSPFCIENESVFIVKCFWPDNNSKMKMPDYAVKVDLSYSKISRLIAPSSKSSQSRTGLYNAVNNQAIFSEGTPIGWFSAESAEVMRQMAEQDIVKDFFTVEEREYLVMGRKSDAWNFSMLEFIPKDEIYHSLAKYTYLWLVYAPVCLGLIMMYLHNVHRHVHEPMKQLVEAFQTLETGDLSIRIGYHATNEFNYLYNEFNIMAGRMDTLVNTELRQRVYSQKMELQQLQAQIKPHFLYNSYFLLHRMILDEDFESCVQLSEHLGNYFQYVTRNESEQNDLEHEVRHGLSYLNIQLMRYGNRIKANVEPLPQQYAHKKMPKLTLQPIIENALEHGIDRENPPAYIQLSYRALQGGVGIVVEDSGRDMTDERMEALISQLHAVAGGAEVTGSINVHRRLQAMHGRSSGLHCSRSHLGGLRVEIAIMDAPLAEAEDLS
jgi:two-component system sensor histidine kinase YesM